MSNNWEQKDAETILCIHANHICFLSCMYTYITDVPQVLLKTVLYVFTGISQLSRIHSTVDVLSISQTLAVLTNHLLDAELLDNDYICVRLQDR